MKRWIHVSGVSQLSTSLNDSLKGLTRHRTPSYNLLSISWTLEIWPLTYQVVSRGSHVSASEIFPPVSGHIEYTPSSSGEMLQYVCSVSAQGSWPLTQILGVLLGATHVGKTISLLLLPTLSSWAPKRVFLPSIIRASRMRPSLVQKQRKVLFDQRMERSQLTLQSLTLSHSQGRGCFVGFWLGRVSGVLTRLPHFALQISVLVAPSLWRSTVHGVPEESSTTQQLGDSDTLGD